MIVGHKIEQTVTVEPRDYGTHYEVTTHRKVTELHSTKGWRRAGSRKNVQLVLKPPTHLQRSKDSFTRFERAQGFDLSHVPVSDQLISERALMRHGWYRRKLRNEAETRVKAKLDAAYVSAVTGIELEPAG